ncbi:hypothetical protein INS49_003082 [Diaporthe citri]|uniref:uncharacterized protein n=1 Tax=Diaporthe citri TaxID=83186 RepID=UPI001C80A601|nr:uncharacterized protein INS49_003082 [Diaporthe citri]KAG6368866.1 hypothetical protein INS49_003082 [Diaporthe citri]
MPEINLPAHTQARLDAAKAAKAAKIPKPAAPVATDTLPPEQEPQTRRLPGYIDGLGPDARRAILDSPDRVAIAYGARENPIILIEKVNEAMLRHYIPHIVNDYYVASTESDDMILLPNDMNLVTERGLKHVIRCMLQEMQRGSYSSRAFTRDSNDNGRYMIRPHPNVVHSVHALNTLRAFGLDHDVEFLKRKDGPIAAGLKLRAQQWNGGLGGLRRVIDTLGREVLEGQDEELLAEARAVYKEWHKATALVPAPKNKA